jgi:uncharacterized protein (DUF608 family)
MAKTIIRPDYPKYLPMKAFISLTIILITGTCPGSLASGREFNTGYRGDYLDRVAFPIGGIGAGMFCIEGNGSFSHFSIRNKPDIFNRPFIFSAISVGGDEPVAKILEGPVSPRRLFGEPLTAEGGYLDFFGVPRFEKTSFDPAFPFAEVRFSDSKVPLDISVTAWSPFIPGDADNSSLPVGGLEYTFSNPSPERVEAVFSFHSENFMRIGQHNPMGDGFVGNDSIIAIPNGFILSQGSLPGRPHYRGSFVVMTDAPDVIIDYCWFRGGWFDSRTVLWRDIAAGNTPSRPVTARAPGASMYFPVNLGPGETATIRILVSWYVPYSDERYGTGPSDQDFNRKLQEFRQLRPAAAPVDITSGFYQPWYSGRFGDISELAGYWKTNYDELRRRTARFTGTFFSSDLPPVVLEAIAANLTILKSPTVLRQKDGKLWGWEGCADNKGSCDGTCTHVWNYAQAVSHLFPSLERSLRETEFFFSQNSAGHQNFRSNLPVRPGIHGWHAAADGQLGGIMKVYREWRISGNNELLKIIWPQVRQSLNYCIGQWDPRHRGVLEEPHHNTYDIEFWGPNGMTTSFYLGALNAAIHMGRFLKEDVSLYETLYNRGRKYMEEELFNGEYFIQKIVTEGLNAPDPVTASRASLGVAYSEEALEILKREGPKYQYGNGCLSDGILGIWLSAMCGLDAGIDPEKVKSHLLSVYRYNYRKDLSSHWNPQRATYAYGNEGGVINCTWPRGDELTFPFSYSHEVWTGIEYQVASHLMLVGEVEKGLDIVSSLRRRYDGRIRNPFNEYEYGHWYARALASYGLLYGLTGIFFDAVEGVMYIDSKIGDDFSAFFSCDTGWGLAGLRNGVPFAEAVEGVFPVKEFIVAGK